jgi:hypothetical protein
MVFGFPSARLGDGLALTGISAVVPKYTTITDNERHLDSQYRIKDSKLIVKWTTGTSQSSATAGRGPERF